MKNDPNHPKDVTNIDFNRMFKTSSDDAGQVVTAVTARYTVAVTKTNKESLYETTAYDKCNTVTVVTRNLTNPSRKRALNLGNEEAPTRLKNDDLVHGVVVSTLRKIALHDWDECLNDQRLLDWFARSVFEEQQRLKGIVPDGWTEIVNCSACGVVYLWAGCSTNVLGCPWCHILAVGLLVPRPE